MEQTSQGSKEPLMMQGPKFGEKGGWWSKFKNWLGRNRSNLILSLIGALIIAGGIYLYSDYQAANFPTDEQKQEQKDNGAIKPGDVKLNGQIGQQGNQTSKEKAEVVKKESGKITVKAQKGAGITHLARKATKEYLQLNQETAKNITPEHKIYIEDYLKDRIGSHGLAIGEELTFDESQIKEAIDQSLKLNDRQLQNLERFSSQVPSLSE